MKGWRSVAIQVLIVALTAGLSFLADFDWITAVGPTLATVILGVIATIMRLITTGPVGTKS
ncbi:MAG: hypothetical protein U1E51_30170 [Candidatus Binatia bacterium]|nr:hypothetical protein [Candidatus Binatia bacterium]